MRQHSPGSFGVTARPPHPDGVKQTCAKRRVLGEHLEITWGLFGETEPTPANTVLGSGPNEGLQKCRGNGGHHVWEFHPHCSE